MQNPSIEKAKNAKSAKTALTNYLNALVVVETARKREIDYATSLGDAVCFLNETPTNSKCRAVIGNQLVEVTPTQSDPADGNAAREHGDPVYRVTLTEVVSA